MLRATMARTGNGQAAVLGPNPLRIPVAAAAGNSYNRMVAIVVVVVVVVVAVAVAVAVVAVVAVAVAVAVAVTATTTTCALLCGAVSFVGSPAQALPGALLPSRAAGNRSKCAAKL